MEMNTRIQVEHTVTEMVTGVDLVREQLRVAAGEPLSLRQEDVVLRGHAIECRINAEDVSAGFRPSPGRISSYREPAGPGVRVDSGVTAGSEVSELYDPMVAKLIVHDVDRERARRRMLRALEEFEIGGVKTLVGFHRALLAHPCFVAGETCHGVVESEELAQAAEALSPPVVAAQADGHVTRSALAVELDGRRIEVAVLRPEPGYRELARRREEREATHRHGGAADAIVSPMQGTVIEVRVAEGDEVEPGAVICIVEAMKMENELAAHRRGRGDGPRGRSRRRGRVRPDDLRRLAERRTRLVGELAPTSSIRSFASAARRRQRRPSQTSTTTTPATITSGNSRTPPSPDASAYTPTARTTGMPPSSPQARKRRTWHQLSICFSQTRRPSASAGGSAAGSSRFQPLRVLTGPFCRSVPRPRPYIRFVPGRHDYSRGVDLYEYQGKELFRRFGIPVGEGRLATTPEEARAAAEELGGTVVVKAQVLTGGRGKAGGVKVAAGPDEAEETRARDPRARHPRARRAHGLGRARGGDREGVLPLGHVRPWRARAAADVHDARRRRHRAGRGRDARGARARARRPARGLPAVARAAADLRRGHRRRGGAAADRDDRRAALPLLRRERRDALRDQPADRHRRRRRASRSTRR